MAIPRMGRGGLPRADLPALSVCVCVCVCVCFRGGAIPLLIFFCLFRATPVAYGSSQARGRIRGANEAYMTDRAIPDLSYIFDLHHSLWQYWILNPPSEACILMNASWVLNPLNHNWNSPLHIFMCDIHPLCCGNTAWPHSISG